MNGPTSPPYISLALAAIPLASHFIGIGAYADIGLWTSALHSVGIFLAIGLAKLILVIVLGVLGALD